MNLPHPLFRYREVLLAGALVAMPSLSATDPDTETPPLQDPASSVFPEWRALEVAPVLHSNFPKALREEERETVSTSDPEKNAGSAEIRKMREKNFETYLDLGFTGIYKVDHDPPYGSTLFLERGLHGLMYQATYRQGMDTSNDPVLDPEGKPWAAGPSASHPNLWSIFSPGNVEMFRDLVVDFSRQYGVEHLFRAGERIILSGWKETDLRTRMRMEYGYDAHQRFGEFLREVVYGEDPGAMAQFNYRTRLDIEDWSEVPMPEIGERYEQALLWKDWLAFHAYSTHAFFQKTGNEVGQELEQPVEMFPLSHGGTFQWPGVSSHLGLDIYWQARLNRVLTVEDSRVDHPGSTIAYALTNPLSRRFERPVISWNRFGPETTRQNDPLEIERTLARATGHGTHGLILRDTSSPNTEPNGDWWSESTPEARDVLAYWHHFYQTHWPFLRQAMPSVPKVALLFPRHTGNMYLEGEYPKADFAWMAQILTELQVPFDIVADNQIEFEPDVLEDYKLLIVPSAAWQTDPVRDAVEGFIKNGGFVYATGDSFLFDADTGTPVLAYLMRHFGIQPTHKYRGLFYPTYDTPEEAAWREQHTKDFQAWIGGATNEEGQDPFDPLVISDERLAEIRAALPSTNDSGVVQSLWDPRKPQHILIDREDGTPLRGYRTFHDVVTGDPQHPAHGVEIFAYYGGEVAGVETKQTMWTGFRPGFDHAMLSPAWKMRSEGDPVWPFEYDPGAEGTKLDPPRDVVRRALDKAEIQRPVEALYGRTVATNVELLSRVDQEGNAMVFVINHGLKDASVAVQGPLVDNAEVVADLRRSRASTRLERHRSGAFLLDIPAGEAVVLAAGTEAFAAERESAQDTLRKARFED